MNEFIPQKVYYEEVVLEYKQGRELLEKYKEMNIETIEIRAHHKIDELRLLPYKEFIRVKKYLVLGKRKTINLTPNDKSSDYIVPFTSTGCSATCLYCYLVCNFENCSYLRIFVNRDEILNKIKKKIEKEGVHRVYELGCNSDMILENTITGNLKWAIEEFGKLYNATATFATKFHQVDELLNLKHNGNTQMRISVNPEEIIRKVEFGTSKLEERIIAANKMFKARYRVGLNIAPIILVSNFEKLYEGLFKTLSENLLEELKENVFIEVIFMTYGLANLQVNTQSMPRAVNLLDMNKMRLKSPKKYTYKSEFRNYGEKIIISYIKKYLPKATISYIV
ncbi:spore photoproduct lyase family protein [uncultured Clostridium sp.]|uniref:SPL family radical SAM protein n=1 Tax=uncultured Clostridium sp. TaxID=59620 RepID=UPI00261EECCC|nr:spore photoproduct lyase [uncultured Clostridium sp.]